MSTASVAVNSAHHNIMNELLYALFTVLRLASSQQSGHPCWRNSLSREGINKEHHDSVFLVNTDLAVTARNWSAVQVPLPIKCLQKTQAAQGFRLAQVNFRLRAWTLLHLAQSNLLRLRMWWWWWWGGETGKYSQSLPPTKILESSDQGPSRLQTSTGILSPILTELS